MSKFVKKIFSIILLVSLTSCFTEKYSYFLDEGCDWVCEDANFTIYFEAIKFPESDNYYNGLMVYNGETIYLTTAILSGAKKMRLHDATNKEIVLGDELISGTYKYKKGIVYYEVTGGSLTEFIGKTLELHQDWSEE